MSPGTERMFSMNRLQRLSENLLSTRGLKKHVMYMCKFNHYRQQHQMMYSLYQCTVMKAPLVDTTVSSYKYPFKKTVLLCKVINVVFLFCLFNLKFPAIISPMGNRLSLLNNPIKKVL